MAILNNEEILAAFADHFPKRIISLVPSLSKTVYDLTNGGHPSGITKFCIHPDVMFRSLPRVGGTKKIDIEKVKKLEPDLVLANKEENIKEQIEEIGNFTTVWLSDIISITDITEWISICAQIIGFPEKGKIMIKQIENVLNNIKDKWKGKTVVYLIWKEPWMTVGYDTFIHSILNHIGMKNLYDNQPRYPVTSPEEIKTLKPDYVFLSSEPFPFKDKDVKELQPYFTESKVCHVKGELFSWYGSYLLEWNGINPCC
jgi:ABC-type Fe3+-hydroxamate transport system substrate-binding protein